MSTTTDPWVAPTHHDPPSTSEGKPGPAGVGVDGAALANLLLAASLRETIKTAAAQSPRSLQVSIGASEIGGECHRQIAYRLAGTPAVNHPDPMRSLVGIGTHLALADAFRRADGGMGRYLVEEALSYRGVPGTCDLYDRWRRLVVDWKVAPREKVRRVRNDGPPRKYIVQEHIYGAALTERGDPVDNVALVYLTSNGDLDELFVWSTPFDQDAADRAITEVETIRATLAGHTPDAVKPYPTRLCPWCAHYQPTSQDPSRACPDGYLKKGATA